MEKIVIYKNGNGRICTTTVINYNAQVQDANRIKEWNGFNTYKEVINYCVEYCGKDENDFVKIGLTKTEKRELAKELLMDSLAVAYYKLENESEYGHISEEDQEEICNYMRQYGESMAKRIGRNYYTL